MLNILYVGFFSSRGPMADNYICLGNHLSKLVNIYGLVGASDLEVKIEGAKEMYYAGFSFGRKTTYFNPKDYIGIFRYINHVSIDIVFFVTPNPINLVVSWISRKCRQVYYLHDYKAHSGTSRIINKIMQGSDTLFRRYCNCIIVASEKIKTSLRQTNKGWSKCHIEVIPLGVLDNLLFPLPDIYCDIDILFFGRIEYYKGIDWFLELAGRNFSNLTIYVVGRGEMIEVCKKICYGHENIHIVNRYVEDLELAHFIKRSRMIVFPYRDATGTQAIPTAFYYGKCVIAADVGSFSEIVKNGINGLLVPPLDEESMVKAVKFVLDRPKYAEELGIKAKLDVEQLYKNDVIANYYMQLFQGLVI